jgi:Tol biopolymer transport system component
VSSSRQNRRASDQPIWRGGTLDRRAVLLVLGVGGLAFAGTLAWTLSRHPPGRDASPGWSPDGALVAFVTDADGLLDLAIMRADGSNRRLIEAAGAEGGATFSPDGTRIAFDSNRDGNREIYVVNRDGSGLRRLTSHPADDWGPAWSPDGVRLVFTSDRDAPGGSDVYRVSADGRGVERLTRTGRARAARFAPDGRSLALELGEDVHVLSLADATLRQLTYAPQDGQRPAWSPDGRIAFVTRRRGKPEIFTMDPSGADQELLVSMAQGGATDPCWSPDGRHIAFVHLPEADAGPLPDRPAHTIHLVELSSGRLTRLSP